MSMMLMVPDDIVMSVQEIAQASGASAEQVLLQVLQTHFPPISPES